MTDRADERCLAVVESVRCLDCGEVYGKPVSGGTVETNPGCPACGYVGWIPLGVPAPPRERRRYGSGRPHLRTVRSG